MGAELAGLVLAAGAGSRLRPLSDVLAKPLCPVGNVALLDLALARVASALAAWSPRSAPAVAVNLSHRRDQIEAHLDRLQQSGRSHTDAHGNPRPAVVRGGGRGWGLGLDGISLHRSIEPVPLGTAGAVGPLRRWLDGRSLLIVNADAWYPTPLEPLLAGWDGRSITVAVSGPPPLHAQSGIVASILPWRHVLEIAEDPEPCGLWERFWRRALAGNELVSVGMAGPFVDCGTPADYLRANVTAGELGGAGAGKITAAGIGAGRSDDCLIDPAAVIAPTARLRRSVVGAGAVVAGTIERCVLWPGASVAAGENLRHCIRTGSGLTVQVDAAAS